MTTQDAIGSAAHRLMRLRNPHRDLAQAMHNLLQARTETPLADLPVVTTSELVALLEEEDDHQTALAYHPPLPVREPDWIDRAMSRSIRFFEAPLNTPARRRLAGATLRRNCPA